jgi:hypothetical protein
MTTHRTSGFRTLAGICGLTLLCGACSATPGEGYQTICVGQGNKPGTAQFDDCVRQQDIARYGDRRQVQRGVGATASW